MDAAPLPALPLTQIISTTRHILSTLINNVQLKEEINVLRESVVSGDNKENTHSPSRKRRRIDVSQHSVDVHQLISHLCIDGKVDIVTDLLIDLVDQSINEFKRKGDVDIVQFEIQLKTIPKQQIKSWKVVNNLSLDIPPKVLDFLVIHSYVNIPQFYQIVKTKPSFKQFICTLASSSYNDLILWFVEAIEDTQHATLLYSFIILHNTHLTLFNRDTNIRALKVMRDCYEDVMCSMLREGDDVMIQFQNLLATNSEESFQNSVSQFISFSCKVSSNSIIPTMSKMIGLCKVNTRNFLIIWFAVLRPESDQTKLDQYLLFLSELMKDSISAEDSIKLILSLLLLRVFDLTKRASYTELYQMYFGTNSALIHTSRSVCFVLKTNISLVPYETGCYLKHKLKLPVKGCSKYKDLQEEYQLLGKTRMRDFTQYEVDSTIVSEVNKCIESYIKRGAIPTAVLEASIFKKQYYINTFLPALLYGEGVIEGREELVAALNKAKKVPQSVLDRKDEVTVLTDEEIVKGLLGRVTDLAQDAQGLQNVQQQLISRFSSVKMSKELVQSLLFSALSHNEKAAGGALGFIKPFLAVPGLQNVLDEVVGEELCKSLNERYIPLLPLCSAPHATLKQCVLYNKARSVPVLVCQQHCYYMKVLALLCWTKVAEAVPWECSGVETGDVIEWARVELEPLCRALEWWPAQYTLLLQVVEYTIQQLPLTPHKLCFTLFSTLLTSPSSLLPLLTPSLSSLLPTANFTKLWVYEALAKVLLPLYQIKSEKPVHVIRAIFYQFFSTVHLIRPSLLLKTGNVNKTDNLCSVLNSYKIYITNRHCLLQLKMLTVICKGITEERQFSEICSKSPTFVLSCTVYFDKLSLSLLSTNTRISELRECAKRVKRGEKVQSAGLAGVHSAGLAGVQSAGLAGVQSAGLAGVLIQHLGITPDSVLNCQNEGLVTSYLYATLHSLSNNWLAGRLTRQALTALATGLVQCERLVEKAYNGGVTEDVISHFSGYKSRAVFPLVMLAGIASSTVEASTVTVALCKAAYPQAQKLVFDRSDVMVSMQKYVTTFTRTYTNVPVLGANFVNCLVAK